MDERFIRTSLVIGEENIDRLSQSRVAVFGVGGVGGFVCEALARSGAGKLILIDGDTVAKSNINRQIIALESTVGKQKAEVMKERILDINPNAEVNALNIFLNSETVSTIDFTQFDYIVDAVDDIKAKVLLAKLADENRIPIISAMGAGNKTDPTKFEVSDIFKTNVCPLARIMRHELKKTGIKKLKVVYSKETPKNPPYRIEGEKTVGSLSFVPSVMGLIIAGEVIKDICKIG
ncbi:tRNA threonylcarbamoyladenosine dehydratase [Ruminococcus sp.]|uniref:tRNA threonylcarbamoyladenosine dehydratase n=1 Tax=Ruminococcus sp. TaxID=41978 RepID=UPI0025F59201|nr:tRNA threonylcarbamoyladenosine dehydratase [Ruminococcus sp.]MCI6616769.1 tRNA threonylcarbamoyladenosine dehydratase [Ruminococcus sp.]